MLGPLTGASHTEETGKVLKMVHNPRMAGSVPAWVKADSAKDEITQALAQAQTGINSPQDTSFQSALSYHMQQPTASKSEEFGFWDLVDMVNPLQHIPLVNIAYRKLTGDEIKGAPKIIGGAIFGGPLGAAGGLVNIVVENETGKDIAGNAFAMFSGHEPVTTNKTLSENPQVRLADALAGIAPENDLPVALLAFTKPEPRGFDVAKSEDAEKSFSPYEIY